MIQKGCDDMICDYENRNIQGNRYKHEESGRPMHGFGPVSEIGHEFYNSGSGF